MLVMMRIKIVSTSSLRNYYSFVRRHIYNIVMKQSCVFNSILKTNAFGSFSGSSSPSRWRLNGMPSARAGKSLANQKDLVAFSLLLLLLLLLLPPCVCLNLK